MEKYMDTSLACEERAQLLLEEMTDEEKAAQLLQISYNAVSAEDYERFQRLGVGSYLHVTGEETDKLRAAAQKTRLKIPPIFGIDAIHGHALLNGAVVFPSQLAMACSFDRSLIYEIGRATALEAAADGIDWTFSPVLCLGRDLRWGRIDETFGEDPYLAGEMGEAIIKGYQADNMITACAKHYIAYGEATGGRDAYDSEVTERKIREVFLPPFEKAVRAGCGTVMTAYGSIDASPLSANRRMLTEILKEELGFEGFVVTDWENVRSLVTKQHAAENLKQASKLAVEAGNDMSMNTPEFYDCLLELMRGGEIDMARVNDAVRRILTVKFKLGLFDGKKRPPRGTIACEEHKELNLRSARECAVLLENKSIGDTKVLPLSGDTKTIAVIGPNADDIRAQYGDWTFFSHPEWKDEVEAKGDYYTVLRGIKEVFPKAEILYGKGCGVLEADDKAVEEAVSLAECADAVVAVVGDCLAINGEYRDRADLSLTAPQTELLKRLKATGKPLIAVLVNGKPLCAEWLKNNCDALIEMFNGGDYGGLAAAEIIAGKLNPSGRLPISFPRHSAQTPCYYNRYDGWHGGKYVDIEAGNVYDFGYGLSYSEFEYKNIRLSKTEMEKGESVRVSVDVTNISDIDGTETVQLYINDKISSILTPVKQLCGFERVRINAGDTKTVSFEIEPEALSLVNAKCERVIESGVFEIMVGKNSEEYLTAELVVK